jgi:hypothetical protein
VGYLANSLLRRFRLRDEDSFLTVAGHAHDSLITARAHQSVHWEDLVTELGLAGAAQFRFSLQDATSTAALRLPGLAVEALPEPVARRGKRAVAAVAWRRPRGYELRWYARDDAMLVTPPLALELFDAVLTSVVAQPEVTVAWLARRLDACRRGHSGLGRHG